MAPGIADEKYLNRGDPNGKLWLPAETDVSIRKGWFYHPSEDDKVRSPQNLVNLYYQSVGRNSLLLLNIPPNREGLLCPQDVAAIKEFRSILDETFKINLAKGKIAKVLTDNRLSSFIKLKWGESIFVNLKKPTTLDRALIQENIVHGQAIESVVLEYWDGQAWQEVKTFTTVGHKRLLRFSPITTTRLRFKIIKALRDVEVSEIGFYKASARE
jgi:alpha-L-fucosidase